jgi:hypothetical protein
VIEADGQAVAPVVRERDLDGRPTAFLYDVQIDEERAATATAGRRCWSSSARRPPGRITCR